MPKFVDVCVAKPSFSSAYILTFKLKPPSYAVPSNFIHCTLQGGDLLEHFKHVQMLDITLCVNQFEASTFPFQAAPLEFKLLRKTLLKCPIQVQDLTVISFRRQNQQLLEIKHFCFRWETWHLQFKFSTPARQGSTSPPLGHGQWAKAYGLLGGGCWSFELIDALFDVFFWFGFLLGIQLCPWVSGLIQGSCWKSAEFCRSCTKITFKMKGN